MTYQEKIDILSGLMHDYDDYCDSRPDYFDYDEPSDFYVGYGFVGPVDDGMCYGPNGPEGTGDDNRLPSLEQDSPGYPGDKTDLYRTGFGDPFAGIVFASGPDGNGDGN